MIKFDIKCAGCGKDVKVSNILKVEFITETAVIYVEPCDCVVTTKEERVKEIISNLKTELGVDLTAATKKSDI